MKFCTALFFLAGLFLAATTAHGDSFPGCSDWEEVSNCYFANNRGIKYERDCSRLENDDRYIEYRENLCRRKKENPRLPGSQRCLATRVCMPNIHGWPSHPQQLEGDCTRWKHTSGYSCSVNGSSRRNGERWVRECVWRGTQMATIACAPRGQYPSKEHWDIF